MRILLSNDDGIHAPGLAALYAAVADMGEVTVVAPSSPQSAAGHSITITQPLVVEEVEVAGERPFRGMSVDGRPADCVRLAVRKLTPGTPDVVLSGINAGANVGVNVFYSGTVAAAAEGAMFGIPSIAFSASMPDDPAAMDWPRAGRLCRWVLEHLLANHLVARDLVSVNLPLLDAHAPRGVRVVRQSTTELEDEYLIGRDAAGRRYYELGKGYRFRQHQENTDVGCLHQGYITVTPLHVDMTTHLRLETMARGDWPAIEQ